MGKRYLLSPPPPRSFHFFALAPLFARPECESLFRTARISFASFGNACYAGYNVRRQHIRSKWLKITPEILTFPTNSEQAMVFISVCLKLAVNKYFAEY